MEKSVRIRLIGPGDIKFHYLELLGLRVRETFSQN